MSDWVCYLSAMLSMSISNILAIGRGFLQLSVAGRSSWDDLCQLSEGDW